MASADLLWKVQRSMTTTTPPPCTPSAVVRRSSLPPNREEEEERDAQPQGSTTPPLDDRPWDTECPPSPTFSMSSPDPHSDVQPEDDHDSDTSPRLDEPTSPGATFSSGSRSSDPDDHNEKMAEEEAVDEMEVVDQVERMEVMEEVKGAQADDLDPSSLHSSASPPAPSPQPINAADAMEDSSVPPPTPSSPSAPPPPVLSTPLFLTPSTSATHRAPSTSHTSSGPHPDSWERRKPDAPKKASNAFHIFYNACREAVRQRHPELSFSNIRTELGWAWRGMSLEERKPYEDRAAADKERYQKEMLDYQASQQRDGSADGGARCGGAGSGAENKVERGGERAGATGEDEEEVKTNVNQRPPLRDISNTASSSSSSSLSSSSSSPTLAPPSPALSSTVQQSPEEGTKRKRRASPPSAKSKGSHSNHPRLDPHPHPPHPHPHPHPHPPLPLTLHQPLAPPPPPLAATAAVLATVAAPPLPATVAVLATVLEDKDPPTSSPSAPSPGKKKPPRQQGQMCMEWYHNARQEGDVVGTDRRCASCGIVYTSIHPHTCNSQTRLDCMRQLLNHKRKPPSHMRAKPELALHCIDQLALEPSLRAALGLAPRRSPAIFPSASSSAAAPAVTSSPPLTSYSPSSPSSSSPSPTTPSPSPPTTPPPSPLYARLRAMGDTLRRRVVCDTTVRQLCLTSCLSDAHRAAVLDTLSPMVLDHHTARAWASDLLNMHLTCVGEQVLDEMKVWGTSPPPAPSQVDQVLKSIEQHAFRGFELNDTAIYQALVLVCKEPAKRQPNSLHQRAKRHNSLAETDCWSVMSTYKRWLEELLSQHPHLRPSLEHSNMTYSTIINRSANQLYTNF